MSQMHISELATGVYNECGLHTEILNSRAFISMERYTYRNIAKETPSSQLRDQF